LVVASLSLKGETEKEKKMQRSKMKFIGVVLNIFPLQTTPLSMFVLVWGANCEKQGSTAIE
jgi:hypothetical protein